MGYDPEVNQFRELNEMEAASFTKGPVFHVGEEVELKGITFTVVDIAPAQIKLKPKKLARSQS